MTTGENKLKGGVAVVTGAGAGIGSGLARRAAELGMTVIVTDVSSQSAEKVCQEIIEAGGKAEAMTIDVSISSNLDELAEAVYITSTATSVSSSTTQESRRWDSSGKSRLHAGKHHLISICMESFTACVRSCLACSHQEKSAGLRIYPRSGPLFLEMQLKKAPIHVSSVIPGMLKTSIFDASAGKDEPESAAQYRTTMREMMKEHGMDLDAGCRLIMEQIAAGNFWVSTQPQMASEALRSQMKFMEGQRDPEIGEAARYILGV
ncbi:hypothetical protein AJ79_02940 [Helicocarpus griseus UAMH5409]|uniref:3-oxoacyl-[acyl-carrier-protein] reductase n=1 Tax=Helicocarpus griseus UAMH5409 TaxID=1447875 RepID=A0A2B7Y081_9EURO|nr:hypothetical protein AJ79_02940 [Helicocarpus griseus UAMH5409]